jgi:probable phosphoglycerate mutase
VRVCLIRHASTSWNEDGRIQGRTDVPLSPFGQAQAASWRLPPGWAAAECVTSPLERARETAAILGFEVARQDMRLAEMSWGAFEGCTLPALRAELGPAMEDLEALGLDFRPPGGESPRVVAARLDDCLRDLAAEPRDRVLITHKGILRASLVLALGWEMRGKPPVRYDPERALIFRLDDMGRASFLEAVPLRDGLA